MSRSAAMSDCASADDGGHAILASLLASVRVTEAQDLASALLAEFGSLARTLGASVASQKRVVGNRPEVTRCLMLVRKAMLHALATEAASAPILNNFDAVISYLHVAMAHEPREQMRVLFLDNRLQLICDEVIHEGSIATVACEPREIIRRALEVGAASLILAHNHPSGNPEPSRPDVQMTRSVADAARVLGIALHDHIVISRTGHASLRHLGLLGCEATNLVPPPSR